MYIQLLIDNKLIIIQLIRGKKAKRSMTLLWIMSYIYIHDSKITGNTAKVDK